MSTVEALAQGTPALGTAVGATPEILTPLAPELVVPAATPEALAEGIRRVLPLLGPTLRSRTQAFARERYAWDGAIVPWERALHAVSRVDAGVATANL
jgi:glycosyltransferase involved in cell wall biosynthesis